MSWSTRTKVVAKKDADAAIDALTTGDDNVAHEDQLRSAKLAAKVLLANIPGPYVLVTMSGHANAVGWQQKTGWANDCVTVSISQSTELPAA